MAQPTLTLVCAKTENGELEAAQSKLERHFQLTGSDPWQIIAPDKASFRSLQTEEYERLKGSERSNLIKLTDELTCDWALQPCFPQPKKLLIADMDSTIIMQESLDELADMVGIGPQIAQITELAMRGELDFKTALARRLRLLKNHPISLFEKLLDERIMISPGAVELVGSLNDASTYCVLATGGFGLIANKIAKKCGFHKIYANQLEVQCEPRTGEDRLTGGWLPPLIDEEGKLKALQMEAKLNQLKLSDSVAIGDGANDLPMLQAAGLGIAYHGKPLLRQKTFAQINHGDLTSALYFQGLSP